MKCSICGGNEASTYERPITLNTPGQAQTQPICDECYAKKHTDEKDPGDTTPNY